MTLIVIGYDESLIGTITVIKPHVMAVIGTNSNKASRHGSNLGVAMPYVDVILFCYCPYVHRTVSVSHSVVIRADTQAARGVPFTSPALLLYSQKCLAAPGRPRTCL